MDPRTYLYRAIPHHLISRLAYLLAQVPARGPTRSLVSAAIRAFVKRYNVDLQEAQYPRVRDYSTFGAFFTRKLRDGARKWPVDPTVYGSPADGRLSESGLIDKGQLLQAKGQPYSLNTLLGSPNASEIYRGGCYATIYLRPGDYHRVHSPIDCTVTQMRHIPGRLWPVRPWAVNTVPGLFTKNERLVIELETSQTARFALVMVGALMVGGIETVASGPIGHKSDPTTTDRFARLKKRTFSQGEELGRFNFGSTVIVLWPPQVAQLEPLETGSPIRLGCPVARSIQMMANR